MKGFPVLMATLLVSGVLAFAQTCPTGYPTTLNTTQPTIIAPSAAPGTASVIYPAGTALYPGTPTTVAGQPYYYPTTPNVSTTYSPTTVSRDSLCILNELTASRNEIRTLRAQVYALALQTHGQMLASRLNALIADEQMFRMSVATNPMLPNARQMSLQLSAESEALNTDIAAFTRELSMIPPDQRPLMASTLNTFDMVYWQPSLQRFAEYRTQFPAVAATYQPAYAANPWMQQWVTHYNGELNTLGQTPQAFASARWWTQPMVLGSTETYATGSCGVAPTMVGSTMMLPSGSVIYIPPSVAANTGMMTTTTVIGTVPSGTTIPSGTLIPSTTTTAAVPPVTTPPATATPPVRNY